MRVPNSTELLKRADGTLFRGHPITELTRFELLALVVWLVERDQRRADPSLEAFLNAVFKDK